jgi:translation initiation factor 2 gamma subunit (eIF-2gamma)
LSEGEVLLINIGSLSAGGRVLRVKNSLAKVQLTKPVCAEISEKIAISRRINEHYRLIGWGEIQKGKELEPEMDI